MCTLWLIGGFVTVVLRGVILSSKSNNLLWMLKINGTIKILPGQWKAGVSDARLWSAAIGRENWTESTSSTLQRPKTKGREKWVKLFHKIQITVKNKLVDNHSSVIHGNKVPILKAKFKMLSIGCTKNDTFFKILVCGNFGWSQKSTLFLKLHLLWWLMLTVYFNYRFWFLEIIRMANIFLATIKTCLK